MKISDINLIAIVGMPGAKKTTICRILSKNYGIPYITISDEIKKEISIIGGNINSYLIYHQIGIKLKKELGCDVFVKRIIPKILAFNKSIVIIDGIRNMEEVEYLRACSKKFLLVAVHASIDKRFNSPHSYPWEENLCDFDMFKKRDYNDLSLGLGNVIALAEYVIINEEYSVNKFEVQIDEMYRHALNKFTSLNNR